MITQEIFDAAKEEAKKDSDVGISWSVDTCTFAILLDSYSTLEVRQAFQDFAEGVCLGLNCKQSGIAIMLK